MTATVSLLCMRLSRERQSNESRDEVQHSRGRVIRTLRDRRNQSEVNKMESEVSDDVKCGSCGYFS